MEAAEVVEGEGVRGAVGLVGGACLEKVEKEELSDRTSFFFLEFAFDPSAGFSRLRVFFFFLDLNRSATDTYVGPA